MATTVRQRSSAKANEPRRHPFAAKILERAGQIVEEYQIVLWKEEDGWYGRGLELPLTMGDGATPDECVKSTRQALTITVAYLLERQEKPPAAADDGDRVEQVNIRLTRREKMLLEQTAERLGHSGLSDYLRKEMIGSAGRDQTTVSHARLRERSSRRRQ